MEIDADNLSATELRLGLPGTSSSDDWQKKPSASVGAKRALDDTRSEASGTSPATAGAGGDDHGHDTAAPAAKAQVVGWSPVRAYRKNTFQQAAAAAAKKAEQQQQQHQGGGLYVKVSMDGAPYLRKVDLRMYKGYKELSSGRLWTPSSPSPSRPPRRRAATTSTPSPTRTRTATSCSSEMCPGICSSLPARNSG